YFLQAAISQSRAPRCRIRQMNWSTRSKGLSAEEELPAWPHERLVDLGQQIRITLQGDQEVCIRQVVAPRDDGTPPATAWVGYAISGARGVVIHFHHALASNPHPHAQRGEVVDRVVPGTSKRRTHQPDYPALRGLEASVAVGEAALCAPRLHRSGQAHQ